MNWDIGKAFDRATGGEGQKEINRLRADPVRLGLAIGTGGASELVYAGIDQGKQLIKNMKQVPNLEATPDAPTDTDPALAAARTDQEMQNRRGRASTILAGSASLVSGNQGSIARRTLLGA